MWHLGRGFREIGYSYIITADGKIHVGRPLPQMGAHARGKNRTSIGICVCGNNTDPAERWNQNQIDALIRLIEAIRLLWPEIRVCGHRDVSATLCPGIDVAGLA